MKTYLIIALTVGCAVANPVFSASNILKHLQNGAPKASDPLPDGVESPMSSILKVVTANSEPINVEDINNSLPEILNLTLGSLKSLNGLPGSDHNSTELNEIAAAGILLPAMMTMITSYYEVLPKELKGAENPEKLASLIGLPLQALSTISSTLPVPQGDALKSPLNLGSIEDALTGNDATQKIASFVNNLNTKNTYEKDLQEVVVRVMSLGPNTEDLKKFSDFISKYVPIEDKQLKNKLNDLSDITLPQTAASRALNGSSDVIAKAMSKANQSLQEKLNLMGKAMKHGIDIFSGVINWEGAMPEDENDGAEEE